MSAETTGTILVVALIGLYVATICVCALKGKGWFAFLGILLSGVFPIVGAIRLAKPDSAWFDTRYGYEKRKRSWERYEGTPYTARS